MELLTLWLLLNVALKHQSTAMITIKQSYEDDHSLDTHTVITVSSSNDTEYNVMYQDLTCKDSVSTCKVNHSYLKAFIVEIMKRDCLPSETVIAVDKFVFNQRVSVGSVTTELTDAFWLD